MGYKTPVSNLDEWWVEFEECHHILHWPSDWPEDHGQSAPSIPQALARCYKCKISKQRPYDYQRVKAIATKPDLLGE
jgi:hypothetical protein